MIAGETGATLARRAASARARAAGLVWRGQVGGRLGPVLGFLALAIILTWPAALTLGGRYIGGKESDVWLFTWNLWWVRHALIDLAVNPFTTRHIFYPDGADLFLHTLSPLAGLLALPALALWGGTTAYNLSVLIGLALAGWATYQLARRWTDPVGAVLAGVAFAASPWLLNHLRLGHLNLMNAGWLPLGLWLMLRATDTGRWRDALLAGLAVLGATLIDWQFTLFLLVAGAVIAVERLLTAGAWAVTARRALRLALVAIVTGLLIAPMVLGALRQGEAVNAGALARVEAGRFRYSADLAAYVVPQTLHPLWGRAVENWLLVNPLGDGSEGRVGLALTALALAGLALARQRPGVWLWLAVGLVGLVLSLGPRLLVGGVETDVPLPYLWLGDLPLVSMGRTPARFAALVALAVAVLAGIGLAAAVEVVRRRWGARGARFLTVGLVALLAFELLPLPYPTQAPPSRALAERLALEPGGAVLELPYGYDTLPRMLGQTIHQRPIFGGYISRSPEYDFLERTPVFADLMAEDDRNDILPSMLEDPLGVLATYGVTTVTIGRPPYFSEPKGGPVASETRLRGRLAAVLGLTTPEWEDVAGLVYRVPPVEPTPVLALGSGWHAAEPRADGWMRWTGGVATLRLDRPRHEAIDLSFTAWGFHQPRRLAVLVDGVMVDEVLVDKAPERIVVRLPASAGRSTLALHAVDGPDIPAALGLGADIRPLAFGVMDVRATPAP